MTILNAEQMEAVAKLTESIPTLADDYIKLTFQEDLITPQEAARISHNIGVVAQSLKQMELRKLS